MTPRLKQASKAEGQDFFAARRGFEIGVTQSQLPGLTAEYFLSKTDYQICNVVTHL